MGNLHGELFTLFHQEALFVTPLGGSKGESELEQESSRNSAAER